MAERQSRRGRKQEDDSGKDGRRAGERPGWSRALWSRAVWLLAVALVSCLPFALLALVEARAVLAGAADEAAAPVPAALPPSTQQPRRIVSLNPCLDAVLLHVADDSQIAALSHFSHDPTQSSVAEAAQRFPVTYETAEEILLLEPDLVLASVHSAPATRRALERMHIPVAAFGVPATVEQSLDQIRAIAARVGHPERGEALVRRIEAALAELRPEPGQAPVPALILQPGGFSPGMGTLQDDLLTRAGLRNVSSRYGVSFWGMVRLEQLVSDPPRLLLSGTSGGAALAGGDRILSHPVLRKLEGQMTTSPYPRHLLYCGGPTLLEAARYLREARDALARTEPTPLSLDHAS